MELSPRLLQIANKVKKNSVVADIGSDHAYIPIFLHTNNIIQKSFACDISKGPLQNAISNIKNHSLDKYITTRLSNGLENITLDDSIDTIIIAGMGGMLIIDILKAGKTIVNNSQTLILQPQKSTPQVRRYLHEIGFFIQEDFILLDDGRYYNIIVAINNINNINNYNNLEYMFGKFNIDNNSAVLKSFVIEEIKRLEKILDNNNINNINNINNNNNSITKLQENLELHKEVLTCLI